MYTELITSPPDRNAEITTAATQLDYKLKSGELDPLHVLANIKSYEKLFEIVKTTVLSSAITEMDKYPKGEDVSLYGAKFTHMEAGVSYDYSGCGHKDYNEICNQIALLNVKKKEYEGLLKAIKVMTPIASADGEFMEVYPPVKRSTTTIKVTI